MDSAHGWEPWPCDGGWPGRWCKEGFWRRRYVSQDLEYEWVRVLQAEGGVYAPCV